MSVQKYMWLLLILIIDLEKHKYNTSKNLLLRVSEKCCKYKLNEAFDLFSVLNQTIKNGFLLSA